MKTMRISENWRLLFLCLILTSLLIGCVRIKCGRMPDIDALASALQPQVSTKEDVLKLLGPPRGYGMGRRSKISGPGVIWYYESIESTSTMWLSGSTQNLKMLLVFFDREKYDGYMWFPLSGTFHAQ